MTNFEKFQVKEKATKKAAKQAESGKMELKIPKGSIILLSF